MRKSLLETNPYLKDAGKLERALSITVESSSAVEGILVKRDTKTGRFIRTSGTKSRPKAKQTSR